MSGESPLRYGASLSWPLVPTLADEDDDSADLPSTVDVKAIRVSCKKRLHSICLFAISVHFRFMLL